MDEILSSTPYVFSARKSSRTKSGLSHSKNSIGNSVNQNQIKQSSVESPTGYNFQSGQECLRRLGSPLDGETIDKINASQDTNKSKEMKAPRNRENNRKRLSYNSNKNSDESVSFQVTPNELTLATTDASIEITAPASTELNNPSKKSTAADAATNMIEAYSACLEGKKTTWEAAQRFPPLLNYLDSKESQDGKIVREKLGQFVRSAENVKFEVMNRETNNSGDNGVVERPSREERLLNLLQIQIWIRIMIWNFCREEGWHILQQVMESGSSVKSYSKSKENRIKGKKKSKKSQSSPGQNFVKDVISLFELAPYVLPPSLEFSKWLKDTLTFGFQQSIPDFGMEILDHFEVEWVNAFEPIGEGAPKTTQVKLPSIALKKASKSAMKLTSQSLVRGKSQQQAYFSSLARKPLSVNADGESATIGSDATIASRSHRSTSTSSSKTTTQSDRETDKALFKKSMSLTAALPKRRENPFLQNSARGVYVGSHFSSKLSNISSLFHEVKAPQKPTVITAKRKNPPEQRILTSKSADCSSNETTKEIQPDNTSSVHNKTASALAFINNKYNRSHQPFDFQSETPRKRLKPALESQFANNSLKTNWASVASTPLQVAGKTPALNGTIRAPINHLSTTTATTNHNVAVEATPLKIIGETPAKQPRNTSRRLRPNSLDGIFVRHSAIDMTPRAHNTPGYSNGLYFGLSPMPGQPRNGSKGGLKECKAKK